VTDLKAANQMLAQAIQALESTEHDADVSEAEAIRNRLLELDAEIGNRIQAKLNAHRMIVNAWGVEPEPIVATDTAEQPVIEAMAEINDWMGKPDETPAANRELIEGIIAELGADAEREPSGVAVMLQENIANKWAAHHETFHTSYAQSGDEITEPVLEVSVAEIQQDNNSPN